MNLLTIFLFAFALPKRRALFHALYRRLYRRLYRAYAWLTGIPEIEITMNGPLVALCLFFTSGGVIGIIVGLLTLMIP